MVTIYMSFIILAIIASMFKLIDLINNKSFE